MDEQKTTLCQAGYHAIQMHDRVVIFANGIHATGGYEVAFERSPLAIFPPQFSLHHKAPTGMATDVMTPFSASVSFEALDEVGMVVVHDADGAHEVPVELVRSCG